MIASLTLALCAVFVASTACLIALWDELDHALDCALQAAFNP